MPLYGFSSCSVLHAIPVSLAGVGPFSEDEGGATWTRQKKQRQRNTSLLLIGTGVFLLLHKLVGFVTIVALLLIILGVYRAHGLNDQKKGYLFACIGVIILISNNLTLVIAMILISLGLFYIKSKQVNRHPVSRQKQKLVESMKCDRDPWVLQNMGLWHLAGEINLDFSLAMPEQEETTIILHGIAGDVDLLIPGDYGITMDAFVGAGRIRLDQETDSGLLNKVQWQSPGYHQSSQKLKLVIFYLAGDIDIKRL